MEDYLEMIYRNSLKNKSIRIKDISVKLNVKPSSVSKMINKLKELGLVNFHKYGQITMTSLGIKKGSYLLYRHNILKRFFKLLNKDNYKLEQVEKIEHFIDPITIKNINDLIKNHDI